MTDNSQASARSEHTADPTAPYTIFTGRELADQDLARTLVAETHLQITTKDGTTWRDAQIISYSDEGKQAALVIHANGWVTPLPIHEIARIRVPDPRTAEQRVAGEPVTTEMVWTWHRQTAIRTATGLHNQLLALAHDLNTDAPGSALFARDIAHQAANLALQVEGITATTNAEMSMATKDVASRAATAFPTSPGARTAGLPDPREPLTDATPATAPTHKQSHGHGPDSTAR